MSSSKYPIFSDQEPSSAISDIVFDGGTPVAECEACGRVHFDGHGEFMEDGELERLEKHQEQDPDKYYAHDQQVHYGTFFGKRLVFGCPCNYLHDVEKRLWGDRHTIIQYLAAQAAALSEEGSRITEGIDSISSS